MSYYQFLACDQELPELFSSKKRFPNGEMRRYSDNNEDFTDLEVIRPANEYYDDIPYYSGKKHIYSLEGDYSDKNLNKLRQYLKDVHLDDFDIEIWSITLCSYYGLEEEILSKLISTKRIYCPIDKLTAEILKTFIGCGDTPKVIIIK